MKADLTAGLDRVLSDTPVGHGYAQVTAGVALGRAFARAEAGARVAQNLALFGFGQWDAGDASRTMAGVGAKFTF